MSKTTTNQTTTETTPAAAAMAPAPITKKAPKEYRDAEFENEIWEDPLTQEWAMHGLAQILRDQHQDIMKADDFGMFGRGSEDFSDEFRRQVWGRIFRRSLVIAALAGPENTLPTEQSLAERRKERESRKVSVASTA